MEQQNGKGEGERDGEAGGEEGAEENRGKVAEMSRKEKRKATKKMKRKHMRKEMAEKEREEWEARVNDPAEQERMRAMEEEAARKRESELKEFEERERAWMEAMELKRKKEEEEEEAEREEEERRRKDLEYFKKQEASEENECCDDDEWEYVEEGPPEIIFQGNEIILRKKKVRVPKKPLKEIVDRPTSNPLPPETEGSPDYQNASSAQQVLENVAQQVPNFGTEQDKAHCPFHLKTGACRFGQRCSRVHFYPDKSCTLLMKNMYNGPGIAWEQDEGLEYTDEEVERFYEEFYEDVHTEFLKYGEIVNFKVCRNGSFHLRGNVYVHYKSLESAVLAYQAINGRYFAGRHVKCEFINVTRWKVAICGEYMKSRFKTCSHGTACNFIHCFRNPGGDYEWADWDKPPPRYWVKKMVALFGYSDEYQEQMDREYPKKLKDSSKFASADPHRQRSRRSRSRDADHANDPRRPSYGRREYRSDTLEGSHRRRLSRSKVYGNDESGSISGDTEETNSDRELNEDHLYAKKSWRRESKWSEYSPGHRVTKKRTHHYDSGDDSLGEDEDHKRHSGYKRKSPGHNRRRSSEDHGERLDKARERRHLHTNRSSNECGRDRSSTDHGVGDKDYGFGTMPKSSERDRDDHQHPRNSSERLEKITHDIASPGERLEEDTAKSEPPQPRRIGSEPLDDALRESYGQENSEMRSMDANLRGYPLGRDWDEDRHQHHKRSSGHYNSHGNTGQRKSSHKSNKKRDQETDSEAERLDRSMKGKRHAHRRRKENGEGVSESPEHNGSYKRDNDSAVVEETWDNTMHHREHHRHKRRHSRRHHRTSQSPENNRCIDPKYDKFESSANKSLVDSGCIPEENTDWMDRWRP